MSETASTAADVIQAGAIVLARASGDPPRLAIVTDLADSDTARVISVNDPAAGDGFTTRVISRGDLTLAPAELETRQQELARRLTLQLAAQAREYAGRLRSDCVHMQDQVRQAQAKIASMRAYAIRKCDDGTICRDGLNDFLAAHDLDPFKPHFTAQVTITLDIEVDGADDRDDAEEMIRDNISAASCDSQVRIHWQRDTEISDLRATTPE